MKDPKIMRYIPKSKWNTIHEAWKDDDGYWITLNEGYVNSNWGTRTIHAETIKEVRYEIASIEKEE